ncbi:hypothetical protein [Actinacidiphila glaucinigra]|uniref:hypothetical protein n=1 Tax=Actinacidiphila glaucinigra TaxID=235986 RepID=UPI002E36E1B9|nr:hypothetical protein [Actinacidiphila glaucinigra]
MIGENRMPIAKRIRAAAVTSKRVRPRMVGLSAGVTIATAALLGTVVAPAQAYSPNPSASISYRDTDNCPCTLSDPFDGTYFQYDAGGYAAKIELRDASGSYISKVEFHPYDEKLWVYDTKNDGDSVYVSVYWWDASGNPHAVGPNITPTGTDAVVDYVVYNLDIAEGTPVSIDVYDGSGYSDYITSAEVVA